MTLVLGLVGEKGSGKQTFTDFLIEIASLGTRQKGLPPITSSIKQIRFSDLLAETLKLWNLPVTRANLQKMAVVMNEGYGSGTLTKAIQNKIDQQTADIIILDGVRWETDVDLVRSFPHNLLVYVTADVKIRYDRLKNNSEKVDEQGVSFDQFMTEEQAKNEVTIPKIGASADIKLDNNGSLDKFKNKITQLYIAQKFTLA